MDMPSMPFQTVLVSKTRPLLQRTSYGMCPALPSRKSSHRRPEDLHLSPENQTGNPFLIKQYSMEVPKCYQ